MKSTELFDALYERYGSHTAVASQLGITIRHYQRIRKSEKVTPVLRRLMEVLVDRRVKQLSPVSSLKDN